MNTCENCPYPEKRCILKGRCLHGKTPVAELVLPEKLPKSVQTTAGPKMIAGANAAPKRVKKKMK
jgi:hypothetical protein